MSARLALTPNHPKWPLAARVAHMGDGSLVLILTAVVVAAGWLFSLPNLRQVGLALLGTIAVTTVIITTIKYLFRRQRPRDPTGFVTISYDKYSFPSGHSARMSCVAVTILYFNTPLGVILLVLAFAVALARVVVNVHYLGDVIAGLVLGAIIALSIVSFL